jgi:tetrahydromethanopterin S-methyltransferase subunit F
MAPHQVIITIRKPEDLFRDSPDDNPMQPEWEANSGMQRVFNHLKTRRLRRGVHVTIQHPTTLDVPAHAMERLKAAIDRYCDARIAENAQERKFTILTGLTGFAYGIVISVLLSTVLATVSTALQFDDVLAGVVNGLATIAVWAIVWGPLAAIFFDWLPNWTAIRVYRTIKRGQYELKPIVMDEETRLF